MTEIADHPDLLFGESLTADIDLDVAEAAAGTFLKALGVRCGGESTARTPRRMSVAYAGLLTPRPFEMTTFPNDEGYDELVIVRSIPVQSLCEHHFLPFTGVAHVAYLPENGSWASPSWRGS